MKKFLCEICKKDIKVRLGITYDKRSGNLIFSHGNLDNADAHLCLECLEKLAKYYNKKNKEYSENEKV